MINYGYFRHRFDASSDPKLQALVDDMGIAALGYYYSLLEIYGSHYSQKMEQSRVEIHRRVVANTWRKRVDSCDKVLTKLQLSGLLVYTKSKNTYTIDIPNFMKYYGSYKKTTPQKTCNKSKVNKSKEKKSKVKETNRKTSTELNALSEIDFNFYMEKWNNELSPPLAPCRMLTDKRKTLIRTLLKNYPDFDVDDYFKRIINSEFLRGDKTGWKADFQWCFTHANYLKVMEGRYDTHQAKSKAQVKQDNMLNLLREYENADRASNN